MVEPVLILAQGKISAQPAHVPPEECECGAEDEAEKETRE
jgi:hypothetical protein